MYFLFLYQTTEDSKDKEEKSQTKTSPVPTEQSKPPPQPEQGLTGPAKTSKDTKSPGKGKAV